MFKFWSKYVFVVVSITLWVVKTEKFLKRSDLPEVLASTAARKKVLWVLCATKKERKVCTNWVVAAASGAHAASGPQQQKQHSRLSQFSLFADYSSPGAKKGNCPTNYVQVDAAISGWVLDVRMCEEGLLRAATSLFTLLTLLPTQNWDPCFSPLILGPT